MDRVLFLEETGEPRANEFSFESLFSIDFLSDREL